MTYGELAEHSTSYQDGHHKGVERAIANAKDCFVETKKKKFSIDEVLLLLDKSKSDFQKICDTYGMGKEDCNEN